MSQSIVMVLKSAIELERYGHEYYKEIKRLVDDEKGKALLTFLANAELEHKEMIENELRQRDNAESAEIECMRKGKEEMFPRFIEIEFYMNNKENIDDEEIKKLFEKLANFEREHLRILEDNLHSLINKGHYYGYTPILN